MMADALHTGSEDRTYQAPELLEVGRAEELTLGQLIGCREDGNKCWDYDQDVETV